MDFIDIEEGDDIEIIEFVEFGIPRQIYERNDYINTLDDVAFRRRFRLSREAALHVLALIDHRLEYLYDLNSCFALNQLLMTLRLYSTGSHLQSIADFGGMHISTVSRINTKMTRLTQQKFYDVASFPRVIGVLDCTHVKLQSPGGEDAEIYRNRKQYFSINTQAVCDSRLKILNLVARWPGSVHDSNIFNHSALKNEFENNIYPNGLLIADSGYPCLPYLMTPLLNPVTQRERLYNESLIRTRNCIERCFGVLKRRFPILAYGCSLKTDTVLGIIISTGVLHNIALEMGDHQPPPLPEELNEHVLQQLIDNGQVLDIAPNFLHIHAGEITRSQLIQEYFSQL